MTFEKLDGHVPLGGGAGDLSGIAFPFFLPARLLDHETVYVDGYDRVGSAAMTGRLCYPLSNLFLLQWGEQRRIYRKGIVIGSLLVVTSIDGRQLLLVTGRGPTTTCPIGSYGGWTPGSVLCGRGCAASCRSAHRPADRARRMRGARNSAILHADGELLAFCNDDDELQRQAERLDASPDAGVVTSGILVRYRSLTIAWTSPTPVITHRQLLRPCRVELHPSTSWSAGSGSQAHGAGRPGHAQKLWGGLRLAASGGQGGARRRRPGAAGDGYLAPIVLRRPLADDHLGFQLLRRQYREPKQEPSGLASIYGQIALAPCGAGERRPAQHRARRRLSPDLRERRAYLAQAVSLGLIPAATVVRLANAAGKGI